MIKNEAMVNSESIPWTWTWTN